MFQPSTILPSLTRPMVVAPEIDRPPGGLAAERVADVTAGHVTERRDPVALDDGLHHLDAEILERTAERPVERLESLRAVNHAAGQAVHLGVGRHQAIDRLLAALVPHLLKPLPHDRIRRSTHLDLHSRPMCPPLGEVEATKTRGKLRRQTTPRSGTRGLPREPEGPWTIVRASAGKQRHSARLSQCCQDSDRSFCTEILAAAPRLC